MVETKQGAISEEVDQRLEDLFGEEPADVQQGDLSPEDLSQEEKGHEKPDLTELKATVLSIEWEITDEVMKRFVGQVIKMKERFKDNKDLAFLLQLLSSVGNYIKVHKAKAHPDAIKALNSIYGTLDKLVNSKEISEEERKKALLEQLKQYKGLKQKIALQQPKPLGEAAKEMSAHEAFVYALEEIKAMIQAEFKALRAELKLWRGQR